MIHLLLNEAALSYRFHQLPASADLWEMALAADQAETYEMTT